MVLRHPEDLAAWHRWQQSRHRLRQLRNVRRAAEPERAFLTTYGRDARILVALDSGSPTSHASLIEPLGHLGVPFAVLSPRRPPRIPTTIQPITTVELDGGGMPATIIGVRASMSLGHYMHRGALAHRWSLAAGIPFFVSQHGALTPYAPPLPSGATLLAWSEADASFWKSGRKDIEHAVVGSQLLWKVGQDLATDTERSVKPSSTLTYLGQMHAAELSRGRLAQAAAKFCRENCATYRPHPSEKDKLSRLARAGFQRLGINVDGSTPLADLTGPVVSVFSTGVLEAAAQGREAWVDFPRPPVWLEEFWERYAMHRFGSSPTPRPTLPIEEPARVIAELLRGVAAC